MNLVYEKNPKTQLILEVEKGYKQHVHDQQIFKMFFFSVLFNAILPIEPRENPKFNLLN